jgi:hypothetical protein
MASAEVSVVKVSTMESFSVARSLDFVAESVSSLRASSAMARLPYRGDERIRAIPDP